MARLEYRADALAARRGNLLESKGAGGLQALGRARLGQAQDGERGIEALLVELHRLEDAVRAPRACRPHAVGPAADALGAPFAADLGFGDVALARRAFAGRPRRRQRMDGDAPCALADLDRGVGRAQAHVLPDMAPAARVVVLGIGHHGVAQSARTETAAQPRLFWQPAIRREPRRLTSNISAASFDPSVLLRPARRVPSTGQACGCSERGGAVCTLGGRWCTPGRSFLCHNNHRLSRFWREPQTGFALIFLAM